MSVAVHESVLKQSSGALAGERRGGLPWKSLVAQAAGMWLASRIGLIVFTYFSVMLSSPPPNGSGMVAAWYRWDAMRYTAIATHGYVTPTDAAFFPLYPALVALGSIVVPRPVLVGMFVSNLATLVAFVGLAFLAWDETGEDGAARGSLLVLAAWPTAFFLAAAYTEGLFLAAVVWCLWSMRRGYWYRAAACALLASLTRSTSVILLAPLAYEFVRQHGGARNLWRRVVAFNVSRREVLPFLAILFAVPVGIGAYSLFCGLRYGDPLIWIHIQSAWHRASLPLWDSLPKMVTYLRQESRFSYDEALRLLDPLLLVLVTVITVASARKMPVAYTLYLLGLLYLTVSTPRTTTDGLAFYGSAGRFMLAAVPAFLLLGRWSARHPTVATLLVYGGTLVQAAFAAVFLRGGWVV